MASSGLNPSPFKVSTFLPPLLVSASYLVMGLMALNWIRHSDRSRLSMVAIGLGFGFVGFIGLTVGATYFLVLVHMPHLDLILPFLVLLFLCLQSSLTVCWVSSPPKRLWH